MRVLLVMGLLTLIGVNNASAHEHEEAEWTLEQVMAVTPMVGPALEKKLAKTLKKLEGVEEPKKKVAVVGLPVSITMKPGATKTELNGELIVQVSVDDAEPAEKKIRVFCHVHHHPEPEAQVEEPQAEGSEGTGEGAPEGEPQPEPTPEEIAKAKLEAFLKTIDCH